MKSFLSTLSFALVLVCFSCAKQDNEISLKWNKAHDEDTFERSITGLKWALSYLGSTVANDSTLLKFNPKDSIITLDANQLGFSKEAATVLSKLHYNFKNTEAYTINKTFDLGRYVSLIFGRSHNYYAIAGVPEDLEAFDQLYQFSEAKGYIDNSSISKVDRIISFSNIHEKNNQAFISAEIDSISKDTLEYETMQIMPNGQLKFGVYDLDGKIKRVANKNVTRAGKPAKCIWCHEVVVQPLYRSQKNHDTYLKYTTFNDTLKYFNHRLQTYQDSLWKDKNFKNKKLHSELELLYIAFMEPNAERISREWNMPVTEVKQKLSHLETHVYEEFVFLGDSYHRKDIDALAPFQVQEAPESIRE
ncbi:hypothetical protein [Spongiimicrobium salis]|uniref:hypothetical protein n=1 Tax=Spongiimicrobium salis TaxID=1667022 RepID=UPI00374D5FE6